MKSVMKINCKGIKTIQRDLDEAANLPQFFPAYGPAWYQELSDKQMRAADAAHTSLAKDMASNSVHHAQEVLRNLGIKPIARPADVRHCLHLSRGSDIAFLWFLRQLAYQSPPECSTGRKQPQQYSVNERLLLSAIAHLDTITTLRQLERMCCDLVDQTTGTHSTPGQQHRPPKRGCMPESPYLQPLPQPCMRNLNRRLAPPPLPGPNFTPYEVYADAEHVVPNEATRWFGEHCEPQFDRQQILGDMFPLDSQRSDNIDDDELLVAFEAATRCRCQTTDNRRDPDRRPVFACQLDIAQTPSEFIGLLQQFVTQILVGTLLKCLLTSDRRLPVLNFIKMCCKCKQCTQDRQRLVRLTRQNSQLNVIESQYERHVRDHLFGKRLPEAVLADFNRLAGQKQRCLRVCVNDQWQYEMRLWSEIDYGSRTANGGLTGLHRQLVVLLREMSERNAHFVLASLPDVCRLPVLGEWLKVRCGHVYTRAERAAAMDRSKMQWQKLQRYAKRINVRPPEELEVCRQVKGLHYGHRAQIMQCVRRLRNAYQHRLHVAIINDGRRLWPTVEPYLCPSGPPRQLFYAYLAGCEYDIAPVRPWCPHEAKDMVNWTKNK